MSMSQRRVFQLRETRPFHGPPIVTTRLHTTPVPDDDLNTRTPRTGSFLSVSDYNVVSGALINDRDVSGMTDIRLKEFLIDIKQELLRRNASAPTPLSRNGHVDHVPTYTSQFSDLSPESLRNLARAAYKESARRFPDDPPNTPSVICPVPIRPPSGHSLANAQNGELLTTASNHIRRSSTTDLTELRNPRRGASPLGPRAGRLRIQHQFASPLRRGSPGPNSPLSPVSDSCLASESTGLDSEELHDSHEAPRDSSIRRLQKMLDERDRELAELRVDREKDAAQRKMDIDKIRKLQDDNQRLTERVRDLEAKQCPWTSESLSEPCGGESRVRTLVSNSSAVPTLSAGVHELLLALSRSEEGRIVDIILQRMQDILDEQTACKRGNPQDCSAIRRLLVRSCRELGSLPPSFFVENVHCGDSWSPSDGGGFSDIFTATWNEMDVALKRLRRFGYGDDMPPEFYREAIVWRQLNHPYIQPFFGIDRGTFASSLCMVSPWRPWGNLHEAIRRLEKRGKEIPVDCWILAIADGLAYLHREKVVHGDLRGTNVLIDDDLSPRLTDFGLASFSDAHTRTMGAHNGGAERWMSPELLDGSLSRPDEKCDVYAFACLCIELYTQDVPFRGIRGVPGVVAVKVLQGDRPPRPGVESGRPMSQEMWNLVQQCWHENPSERPTMAEVVEWLTPTDQVAI